jgi:rubrerythrin
MRKSWCNVVTSFSGTVLAMLLFACVSVAAANKTLDNLMEAYNGQSNAHARYLAFAGKADDEGYDQVASLFRAAARAEELHANNHAEVIRKMGRTPKVDVKPPNVKSTAENLQAAIQGESYERDTMYPEFIAQARTERNRDAIRSFNYALSAETEHAKLYAGELDQLGLLKGSKPAVYYMCTVCGYTVRQISFSKCPSCFNPVEKYVKVS